MSLTTLSIQSIFLTSGNTHQSPIFSVLHLLFTSWKGSKEKSLLGNHLKIGFLQKKTMTSLLTIMKAVWIYYIFRELLRPSTSVSAPLSQECNCEVLYRPSSRRARKHSRKELYIMSMLLYPFSRFLYFPKTCNSFLWENFLIIEGSG